MASNKQSKGTVAALATQIIAGMTKHLSGTTQIVLGEGSFTPAQVTEQAASCRHSAKRRGRRQGFDPGRSWQRRKPRCRRCIPSWVRS